MVDTYGAIARARGSMMMRGHADLELHLGPDALRELQQDHAPFGPFDLVGHGERPQRMLFMPVVQRSDMEGWAVVSASRPTIFTTREAGT